MRGSDPTEMLALARLACDVPDEIDDAPVFAAIRGLLDTTRSTPPSTPTSAGGSRS